MYETKSNIIQFLYKDIYGYNVIFKRFTNELRFIIMSNAVRISNEE